MNAVQEGQRTRVKQSEERQDNGVTGPEVQ